MSITWYNFKKKMISVKRKLKYWFWAQKWRIYPILSIIRICIKNSKQVKYQNYQVKYQKNLMKKFKSWLKMPHLLHFHQKKKRAASLLTLNAIKKIRKK